MSDLFICFITMVDHKQKHVIFLHLLLVYIILYNWNNVMHYVSVFERYTNKLLNNQTKQKHEDFKSSPK